MDCPVGDSSLGGTFAAMTRIQFPAGSIRLNPDRFSAFFRRRGRVIRGYPVNGSLPYLARSPAANFSKRRPGSSTTTPQEL